MEGAKAIPTRVQRLKHLRLTVCAVFGGWHRAASATRQPSQCDPFNGGPAVLLLRPVAADNAAMESDPRKSALVVRRATDNDEPAATLLAQHAFDELRSVYRPKESATAADSPELGVIAEVDNRIVGTVRYRIEAEKLHLRGLAVEASYRRQGIGRALLAHCSRIAKSEGLRALSLYTIKETGNVSFFERLGFRVVRGEPASWAVSAAGADHVVELYLVRNV